MLSAVALFSNAQRGLVDDSEWGPPLLLRVTGGLGVLERMPHSDSIKWRI